MYAFREKKMFEINALYIAIDRTVKSDKTIFKIFKIMSYNVS